MRPSSRRYAFGYRGNDEEEFNNPSGVALGGISGGELFVADRYNQRVQVFAAGLDGQMRFARMFGGKGDAPGQFKDPVGVACVRGRLVVSEAVGQRLQVLSTTGVPLQVIKFKEDLAGLCADAKRLWVASSSQHQVRVLLVMAEEQSPDTSPERAERSASGDGLSDGPSDDAE